MSDNKFLEASLEAGVERIAELEAQLAELKSPPTSAVPEKRIDDSDYSTGWNDCRAWVIQSSYTAPPNRRE